VSALGLKPKLNEDELQTAALTIRGVETRHAAYLNGLPGGPLLPEAVNPTLTPDEVLAAAGRSSSDNSGENGVNPLLRSRHHE
jgi:hypothetical protein